jgi:hypothetical protein
MSILSYSAKPIVVADSLFTNGQFFEAAIEYERQFYFASDLQTKSQCRFGKALCYKAMGDFKSSKKELLKVNIYGLNENNKKEFIYETALISYLDEDYLLCERTFLQLNFQEYDSIQQQNLLLIGTLNNIMLQKFEKSEELAKAFVKQHNQDSLFLEQQLNALHKLYSKRNLPRLKSEKAFDWINIAPGFGQIYVGKVGEGFMNIGLNLAAFSFGAFQFLNGYYFTGYFVGALSINKFYFGGRTRAKNLMLEVNNARLVDYNTKIKNQLVQLKP